MIRGDVLVRDKLFKQAHKYNWQVNEIMKKYEQLPKVIESGNVLEKLASDFKYQ